MFGRITRLFAVVLGLAGSTAWAGKPWVLSSGNGSSTVVVVPSSMPEGIRPKGTNVVVVPQNFIPTRFAGEFLAGRLRQTAGEESLFAVVNLAGQIVFQSTEHWMLSASGDAVTTVLGLPLDADTARILGIEPLSVERPAVLVRSCLLSANTCRNDIYYGDFGPGPTSYYPVAFGDVLITYDGEFGTLVARWKAGNVSWIREAEGLLNPAIWDVHLERGEVLVGCRASSALRVLSLDTGNDRFAFSWPDKRLTFRVKGMDPEHECRSRTSWASSVPGAEAGPETPTPERFWAGWARFVSGKILDDGRILVLGDRGFSSAAVSCQGQPKVFIFRRGQGDPVGFRTLAQAGFLGDVDLWACRLAWDVAGRQVYLTCPEGSSSLNLGQ